jgi:DNA-binding MarR family transcriptional regulator
MTEKSVAEWFKLFGKNIELILILFREDGLKFRELAEKLKVTSGYLSRRIKPLTEHDIIRVEQGIPSGGRPPNLLKLSYRTRQTLDQMIRISNTANEKKEIPDLINFNKIVALLVDENESEDVTDIIQQTSYHYRIPANSYFFRFLAENLPKNIPEKKIRVILDSTKEFISEISDHEKTQVFETLEGALREVLYTNYSNRNYNIHKRAQELLDLLDMRTLRYIELEQRYLDSIKDECGYPETYRELILDDHKDKLYGLWLKIHQLSKSKDPNVSSRAGQEKSLLRL